MQTNLLIILTILGWGLGSFFYKLATDRIDPIFISTLPIVLYVVVIPLVWMYVKFDHTITLPGVVYTMLGSLGMCFGSLAFTYALKNTAEAGKTTIITALYPALTLVLSMLFLGEMLTMKKSAGIVLAVVSFVLLSMK